MGGVDAGAMVSAHLSYASATYGNVSAAVSEYWVKRALTHLTPDLVFVPLCSEGGPGAWLEVPVGNGKKVHFHRLPVMTAKTTDILEQTADPDSTTAALVGVTALVQCFMDWMLIGDLGEDASFKSTIEYCKEMLGQSLMRTADALVYAAAVAGATTAAESTGAAFASASVSAGAGCELSLESFEYLAYLMKSNNVRQYPGGYWKYIAHPFTIKDVRAATASRQYVDIAKNLGGQEGLRALQSHDVGKLCGFKISETTEVSTAATHAATTAYAYQNIAAGYESIGMVSLGGNTTKAPKRGTGRLINRPRHKYRSNVSLIVKGFGSAGTQDPLNRRASVGWKMRTTVKVLDAARLYLHYPYGGAA